MLHTYISPILHSGLFLILGLGTMIGTLLRAYYLPCVAFFLLIGSLSIVSAAGLNASGSNDTTYANIGDITILSSDTTTTGIDVNGASNNVFGGLGAINVSSGSDARGIDLGAAHNNSFSVIRSITVNAVGDVSAIFVGGSDNNNFARIGDISITTTGNAEAINVGGSTPTQIGDIGDITLTGDVVVAFNIGGSTQTTIGNVGDITLNADNYSYALHFGGSYNSQIGDINSITIDYGAALNLGGITDMVIGDIGSITVNDGNAIDMGGASDNTLGTIGSVTSTLGNGISLGGSTRNSFAGIGNIYVGLSSAVAMGGSSHNEIGSLGNIVALDGDGLSMGGATDNIIGTIGDVHVGAEYTAINLDGSQRNTLGNIGHISAGGTALGLAGATNNVVGNVASITVVDSHSGQAAIDLGGSQNNELGDIGDIKYEGGNYVIDLGGSTGNSLGNLGDIATNHYKALNIGGTNNISIGTIDAITVTDTSVYDPANTAYALFFESSTNNSIGTIGAINLTSTHNSVAPILIDADAGGNPSTDIVIGNIDAITAVSNAEYAYGIDLLDSERITFGDINSITARGGNDVYAVSISASTDITLGNMGTITAQSSSSDAHGVYLSVANDNKLSEIQKIDIKSGSDTGSLATALYLATSNNNTLANIGAINIEAGGRVMAVNFADSEANSLANIGDLRVQTTTGQIQAIQFGGSHNNTIADVGDINLSTTENTVVVIDEDFGSTDYSFATVFWQSDNNTIGSIQDITTSAEAIPLAFIESDANQVTLAGTVVANNTFNSANTAIVADVAADANIVTFNPGAVIVGAIVDLAAVDSETSADQNILRFNMGAGASYDFNNITGDWQIQEMNARPMIEGSAHSVGVSNVTLLGETLYHRSRALSQTFSERVREHMADTASKYWVNSYVSSAERDEGGVMPNEIDHEFKQTGVNFGLKMDTDLPIELVLNIENSDLEVGANDHHTDSNSFLAGALFPALASTGVGNLSAHTLFGYSKNDVTRKVYSNDVGRNGAYQIDSDYHAYYFLTGLQLTQLWSNDNTVISHHYGLDINAQFIESYAEGSLVKWEERDFVQAQPYAGMNFQFTPNSSQLTYTGGARVTLTEVIGGQKQNYRILGTDVGIKDEDENDVYYEAKLGVLYRISKDSSLETYAQILRSDDDMETISAGVTFNAQF